MAITLFLPIALSAESITLATWNVRILSDNSRNDAELAQIARIMGRYDFIAVQEVRDTRVLDRLVAKLPGYTFIASDPVGRDVKEIYAFVYREDVFRPLGSSYVFPDPDDRFIREPFVGHFVAEEFDFTIVTIHLLYGDSASHRREELRLLDEVLGAVDEYNGAENDTLLAGDFNFPADDNGWELNALGFIPLVAPSLKTTITDTSSYDNIWLNLMETEEFGALLEIFAFDEAMYENDDRLASLEVSDHRPVAATFSTDRDDDAPGSYDPPAGIPISGQVRDIQSVGIAGTIKIAEVVKHPTDAESITLTNTGTAAVDLNGWYLGDLNDPHSYRIPRSTVIEPGARLVFRRSTLGFGINNVGETIYLWNAVDQLADTWTDQ